MNLKEAARNFTYSTIDGHISIMYADPYTDSYYKKKYGEETWKEACNKARIEYNFGSNAVRW